MRDGVKCAECGFLTWQCRGEFIEIGIRERVDAQESMMYPICFVRAFTFPPLPDDWPRDAGGHPHPGAYTDDILRARTCDKFTPYQQGYSPKEHREMHLLNEVQRMNHESLEQERRERALERRADRAWNLLCSLVSSGIAVFLLEYWVFGKR